MKFLFILQKLSMLIWKENDEHEEKRYWNAYRLTQFPSKSLDFNLQKKKIKS